jgi:hypothetical protein
VQPRLLTSAIICSTVTGGDGTSNINTPPPSLELVPKQELEPPMKSTLSGVLALETGAKDRGGGQRAAKVICKVRGLLAGHSRCVEGKRSAVGAW